MANTGDNFKESSVSEAGDDNSSQSHGSTATGISPKQQCELQKLKTKELIMGWPIVSLTVEKIQKYYQSFKSSNKILNWGCEVSEKYSTRLYERFAPVRAALCPAIRFVDMMATDVAERVQKKLPVVRESPSKVYESVKSGFCGLIAPLWGKTELMVSRGESWLRRVVKSSAESCRKYGVAVDKWLFEVDLYIENYRSKGLEAPQVTEGTYVTRPVDTKSWTRARTAFGCAATVAMFSLGAAVSVLSRLPFIGRVVTLTPPPSAASSKSTPPKSDKSSIPDVTPTSTRKRKRSDFNLESQLPSEQ